MSHREGAVSQELICGPLGARAAAGRLDGRTIVRFAHAFATGGGVERYLDDVDRALLSRNAMTILRIFIGSPSAMEESTETIGRGVLVRIPLAMSVTDAPKGGQQNEASGIQWRSLFRDWVLYNPLIWGLCMRRYVEKWKVAHRPGEVIGAGQTVKRLYLGRKVDLTMLHFFGGGDADEIIEESRRAAVPYAVLNHFANDRFLNLSIRKHVMFASGIAGVSGIGAPRYLRGNFRNLSDGIDVDFFHPSKGSSQAQPSGYPLVLLPARVVRAKGHLDLVKAAGALMKMGVEFNVGFVGRSGSPVFHDELLKMIGELGLTERVRFVGELSVEGLRDWYKTASIVAFPTYHHEGLPRVLLEAQAMQVPVVAYSTGGTAEGLVNGQTGILLKTGDVSGLTDALRRLLEATELRAAMGIAGRKLIEGQFSLEALAVRHEEFYSNVISDGKKAGGR